MGLFGFSLPKRNRITDAIGATARGASRTFDQVNPLDNGRSWQTRTPQTRQSVASQVRDVFDANSARDMQKRGGQTYRQQQIAMGNKRPLESFGAQVVGNTARFANTGVAAGFGAVETGRGTLAQVTKNMDALNASLKRQEQQRQYFGDPSSGLMKTGTIFDSPEEMKNLGNAEIAKRVGLNTLGTASEVLPFARVTRPATVGAKGAQVLFKGGKPVANKAILTASMAERGGAGLAKRAAFNAAIDSTTGAGESAARQYTQTGKIDPKVLLGDTAASTLLGQTQVAAGALKGKVKASKPTVKAKISEPDLQKRNNLVAQLSEAERKGKNTAYFKRKIDEIDNKKPLKDKLTKPFKEDDGFISTGNPQIDDVLNSIEKNKTKLSAINKEQVKLDRRIGVASRAYKEGGLPSSTGQDFLKAVDKPLAEKKSVMDKLLMKDDEVGSTTLFTQFGKDETVKPVVKPKQPTPDPGYRPRTADEAIREIAGIGGEEIGQASTGLGLTGQAISTVTGGKYTTTRKLNPFRAASDAAGKAFNESSEASITGAAGAPVVNKARAAFAGTGLADETKQIARMRTGQNANINDLMTRVHKKADDIQATYGDEAKDLIDRTVRDEAYTQRVYGEAPRRLEDLPPELQGLVREKMDQNKVVNDLNRQTGIIDEKTWQAGTEGQHIGRVFNIPPSEKAMIREGVGAMLETNAGIKRKDISKMTDEVIEFLEKDPIRAIDLRMEMALRNKVFSETMDSYADRGFIKKRAPNDSYLQINGKKWGKYDGQFIERGILEDLTDNRVFNNEMMQSYDKFITGYKSTLLGTSDRLQKAFKTTMAPGTIVGNFFSNPMIFNVGAGTNPLTQIYDMVGAYRKMAKGLSDADVYEARKLGVIGGDSGRILTGTSTEKLAIGSAKDNIAKRALNKFGRFYGAIDDGAKLGLWKRLQKQGMNAQDAALEVAKFTQDYNNVGRTITLIADTPVLGKPFARFSPELVRLIKNNATRAPHRLLAGIAALAYIGNKMSESTGETPEERAAREGAVGQTKIPGTEWINQLMGGPKDNISLNLAAGDTSVNIARSMGLNFPIEPGTDPNRALVEQLLPFEIPVTKDALGNDKFDPTKVATSMTVRPAIEQLFDRNFMGRRVSDPTNQAYDSQGNVMKFNDLPKGDQVKNRLRALATSSLPLGNEVDSLQAAFRGKATALGKERTVPQALLRTVGIKTEDNSPTARAKRADTAEYFEVTKKAESDFLNNNKDLEELYFKVFPKTKDRETGKKLSDQITPEKWGRVQSDTSGRLYDFMKQQALTAQSRDGQPVDPVFLIPTKEQQRQVLELRSKPTGEDIEMDNIMEATQGWYRAFKKAESKYYEDSTAYYKSKNLPDTQNQRAKDYANVKWPEQDKLISQYYTTKQNNPEAAKAMFETTNLSQAFDKYKQDKLKYYNAKRKIEGVPPLDEGAFNNVTFGYEDDERKVFNELKYGKGYGGYGSGGGGGNKDGSFNTSKYMNSISAGSNTSRPKVSVSVKQKKVAPRYAQAKKPTVSIKKSRV